MLFFPNRNLQECERGELPNSDDLRPQCGSLVFRAVVLQLHPTNLACKAYLSQRVL